MTGNAARPSSTSGTRHIMRLAKGITATASWSRLYPASQAGWAPGTATVVGDAPAGLPPAPPSDAKIRLTSSASGMAFGSRTISRCARRSYACTVIAAGGPEGEYTNSTEY